MTDLALKNQLQDMLKCVEEGLTGFSDETNKRLKAPMRLLRDWISYQYQLDSKPAAIMDVWFYMIATYMHEAKIEDVRLRQSLG